jgi:hypothetical protein
MSRSFGSLDLVQLPRLDASSAQTLGKEVIVAANGEPLPAAVAEALADLTSAHAALEGTVAVRLPTSAGPDPARTKKADTALDAAWSALYGVLKGWSVADDLPEGGSATVLLPKIFPEGLKFVLLAYKLEWAESSARLRLISDQALDRELEKLAAGPLLQIIRDAHDEYGNALGVTAAEAEADVTSIRDALSSFSTALRDYVVRVAASVNRRDPKTQVLADVLLGPIQKWESPGSAAKVVPPPETAPPQVPGAPPTHSTPPPAASEPAPKN